MKTNRSPPLQLRPLQLRPLQLRPLQLRPLQLPPLHLPPLHLPPLHLPPRLNVDPLRLNLCPPRGDIELKCPPCAPRDAPGPPCCPPGPPCPPCPPPLRGSAFTAGAINVIAAKQLKNSMNFAFIGYLGGLSHRVGPAKVSTTVCTALFVPLATLCPTFLAVSAVFLATWAALRAGP